MSQTIDEWIQSIDKLRKIPYPKIQQGKFLRDPIRRMMINPEIFYSPADGIIMYQKIVDGDNDLLSIKGQQYTLSDLMEKDFEEKCLVIGIFMTFYDVHVNRIPYGGMLKFRYLTPIVSTNKPMDDVENDILKHKIGKAYDAMGIYLKYNARMVNEIYIPELNYKYYLTQIADDEVNVISHFTTQQNQFFHQNQRFSFVRWGSQVELVLPIDKRFKFKTLVPQYHHVKGCLDALVKIV